MFMITLFENPKSSKAIRSSRAFLCCLPTPDNKNFRIYAWFKNTHILDAYLAQIKVYISVYMSLHYLSEYFESENKSFIEFTPFGYQTGVFQRLFRAIKIDKESKGFR